MHLTFFFLVSAFLGIDQCIRIMLDIGKLFIILGSKITADGDCSHEIKRCLLLGRKAVINLDNILKSRDIPLLTKICIVKAMVFPVVMYECESWTIKKAEYQRIDVCEYSAGEDF